MADILQLFPVRAAPAQVYQALATPAGLDRWWTLRSSGTPAPGESCTLDFGPGYDWRARVTRAEPGRLFELAFTQAADDWRPTILTFRLTPEGDGTLVRFGHTGWAEPSDHFQTSSHGRAMYLRLLRRHLEYGEVVPYPRRLEA
jgi:uncharacterized protein YndB with AHSA1/START domain